jgi:hypothetical protein
VNQRRLLLFAAFILLSTSTLHGQAPALGHDPQWGQPAVCNNGKIPFWVARAHRHAKDILLGGGRWEVWGWFAVDPGKCTDIGAGTVFESGGWLGSGDSVTLLGFAFVDSKGVWRGIKVQGEEGWFYPISPSNQQICVGRDKFQYVRDGLEQSDLARECQRTPAEHMLIPASFMYKGSSRVVPVFGGPDRSPDYLYVKVVSDDRAMTSGNPVGSAGITRPLNGGGAAQSNDDSNPSLCGKVSCWDIFLQRLNEAARQRSATNANSNPPAPRASTNPPPPAPRATAPPPPVDDDDPIGTGGFITPPSSSAPPANRANSAQWVRADILAYLEASKTGFAAYKKGDVLLSQGYRMWDSNTKPSAARGCWVVQGTSSTTLSCALSQRGDLNELRPDYTGINKEIAAALPRDWKAQAEPPFGGDLPNQGYKSSSGAHLEVFFAPAPSGPGYEINFQLVSAH